MADNVGASRLPAPAPAAAPGAVRAAPEWTIEAADRIERVVDTVRSNTSDRLVSVARLVVYGILAAIMGLAALVLLIVGAVRLLDVYVANIFGSSHYARSVWVVHAVLGGLFFLAGLFLWSKRNPRDT